MAMKIQGLKDGPREPPSLYKAIVILELGIEDGKHMWHRKNWVDRSGSTNMAP